MRIPSILTLLFTVACFGGDKSVGEDALIGESDRPAWDPDPQTIDNGSSSTTVSWTPPDEEEAPRPNYYNVVVTSEFGRVISHNSVVDTSLQLTNLRTDTEYSIDIDACYDQDCLDPLVGEPIHPPTWRTEIESWVFPEINGEEINPLFGNAYAPTLINLSELPINQDGWVLTNIQNDGGSKQIQVSVLRDLFIEDNLRIDFLLESPVGAGVQDAPEIIDFTSSSARAVNINGEWTLEVFVSLTANIGEERSMIGSWTSDTGVTSIDIAGAHGYSDEICKFGSLEDTCGMNTCMDSQSDSETLANMDCISLIPNVDDLMLVQGRTDSNDNTAPNLYIAQSLGNGEWSVGGQNNPSVEPILSDATGASVHVENDVGKLYYWDENSGSAYIRYWDPTLFGDPSTFELDDLESEDRVRHVYYTDQNGEVMLPWNFKVVERTFLTKDDQQVMLSTVETSEGKRHITFGVLSNP